MIKNISKKLLSASELLLVSERVVTLIKQEHFNNELVAKFIEKIEFAMEGLKSSLSREAGSEYTELIESRDDIRDEAFIGFRDYAEAMTRLGKGPVKEAALKITGAINKYGRTHYKLGNTAQSSQMVLLKDEIEKNLQTELGRMGAEEYFADLVKAQDDFEHFYNLRLTETTGQDIPRLREAKALLGKRLSFMLDFLEMIEDIYPAHYAHIEEPVNRAVTEVTASAKARKTRRENEGE